MTFPEFWNQYHTPISLLLGVLITVSVFRIPKLNTFLKIVIILFLMLMLTGLVGTLKYLALVLAVFLILYGAFVSVFGIGIMILFYLDMSNGWDLAWWQIFLISGVWGPVAMLINVGMMYVTLFLIYLMGITSERLPARIKHRLGITDDVSE